MSEQYFSKKTSAASDEREHVFMFEGQSFRFLTDRGVFSKTRLDYGTEVLIQSMLKRVQGTLLDLGCGYGPVGVILGKLTGRAVVMSDVNERAVDLARRNAERNRVKATVIASDGFSGLEQTFDTILLNPPIRAGKEVIYRLFADAREHLSPAGQFAIVIQKKQGADSARKELERLFGNCETIERSAGFHVLLSRK